MSKRLIVFALAILWTLTLGCASMLDPQAQKDKNLAHVMEENLRTSIDFQTNFIGFKFLEPGKYQVDTKDLNDGESAGKYAYNVMSVLVERNNTKLQTGRTAFTLIGMQGAVQIFEVRYTGSGLPRVTLMGPYEGQTFEPNKNK
jgi:hypothetical protein